MGHTSVTLVGNCLGGNIAMELARLYPDMVERLILIATTVGCILGRASTGLLLKAH